MLFHRFEILTACHWKNVINIDHRLIYVAALKYALNIASQFKNKITQLGLTCFVVNNENKGGNNIHMACEDMV